MMKKMLLSFVALAFLAVGVTDADARSAAKKKKSGKKVVETIVIEPSA